MIPRELANLTPARRADVIYAQAQSELSNRLWHAALGDSDKRDAREPTAKPTGMTMDSLLATLDGGAPAAAVASGAMGSSGRRGCFGADDEPPAAIRIASEIRTLTAASASPATLAEAPSRTRTGSAPALGANAQYGTAFAAAEARSGIPASALAAIVDAEAGKRSDGSWNVHSRNPRSSAAGLGQFLSGTWQEMAQTRGTWLNGVAQQRGWLDARGRVEPAARAELLALRYDPQASILTVADLAKNNLDRLERDGLHVRNDPETLAKAAYLGHHLGLGDTRRFLGSGLTAERARVLLTAQVGSAAAQQRIGQAGGATQAHRQWLLGYIDRRIQPGRSAA
jgi:hypothetical protein